MTMDRVIDAAMASDIVRAQRPNVMNLSAMTDTAHHSVSWEALFPIDHAVPGNLEDKRRPLLT